MKTKEIIMKTISIFLIGCLTVLSVYAQTTANTVTITLNGSRYHDVVVDGKTYPVTNSSTTNTAGINGVVIISDLQPGQHTMQVVRTNSNNNNNNNNNRRINERTFNLRSRYDLAITVNNDGTVELKETRSRNNGNASRYRTPMTDANFSVLLQNVVSQRKATAKTTAVTNAVAVTNNYFTTDQTGQLLELVPSESKRMTLAKSVYPKITDPVNFSQLYDLFDIQTNRDALAAYVSSYNAANPVYNNNNNGYNNNNNNNGYNNNNNNGNVNNNQYKSPMPDASFNNLVQNVRAQWLPGAKMSALTDAFANTNNYFSTYQAKQLIQLVSDESNRLQLAKSAYPRITDPANFSQLYDLFGSQASRDELALYVNSYNGNTGNTGNTGVYNTQNRVAMSDASFNSLVQNVKSQWLPGAKMSALTDIFANTSNYFTAYQAKQLIQLVSDEDNRLQLAKSAYRNTVDPANFSQLYDLFTSQTRKNELANYVNSYSYNRGY